MTRPREDLDALTLAGLRQLTGATPGTAVLFKDRQTAREALDLITRLRAENAALRGALWKLGSEVRDELGYPEEDDDSPLAGAMRAASDALGPGAGATRTEGV